MTTMETVFVEPVLKPDVTTLRHDDAITCLAVVRVLENVGKDDLNMEVREAISTAYRNRAEVSNTLIQGDIDYDNNLFY